MASIWSGDTGHIGVHGGVDGRTVAQSPKPNFLTQMGYHIFTHGTPHARLRRVELRY